jgi:hypothetical protein
MIKPVKRQKAMDEHLRTDDPLSSSTDSAAVG